MNIFEKRFVVGALLLSTVIFCFAGIRVQDKKVWHIKHFVTREARVAKGSVTAATITATGDPLYKTVNDQAQSDLQVAEADGYEPFSTTSIYVPSTPGGSDIEIGIEGVEKTTIWLRKQE